MALALLLGGAALLGAVLGRWTLWSPLLTGALLGLSLAPGAWLVTAMFTNNGAVKAAVIFWIVVASAGAAGAFLGRLRRQRAERRV